MHTVYVHVSGQITLAPCLLIGLPVLLVEDGRAAAKRAELLLLPALSRPPGTLDTWRMGPGLAVPDLEGAWA